jgi:hypothetical protein
MWWWPSRLPGASLTSKVESIRAGREILRQISADRLARFDATLHGRSWTAPKWFPSLWEVEPHHVDQLAELSGDGEATAVILAAHPSGWVRQAALPLLQKSATPLALGMLVLRSNDWVEPIRRDAQARLRAVAAAGESSQRLVSVLPAVEQLAKTPSRSGEFAKELLRHLSDRLTATTLASGLRDVSVRVRRSSARLLVGKGLSEDALDIALRQDDAITASIVAEAAAQSDPTQAMSERLIGARSPRIRRLGFLRLLEQGERTAETAARKALLDSHVHVRSEAQRFLARHGVAVNLVYAGWLESRPAIAILGLAETGSEADAGRVTSHASHPSSRVRDAVCLAIAKLDPQAYRQILLELARDPSVRVARRAASAIVRSNASAAELDYLWSLVATPSGRRAVLSAFQALDRWVQLTYAFRAVSSDVAREEGASILERVMARWNASFTAPAADRARELASLLPKVVRRLESKAAREVEFTVGAHLGRYLH